MCGNAQLCGVCRRLLDSIKGNVGAPPRQNFQTPMRLERHSPEGKEKIDGQADAEGSRSGQLSIEASELPMDICRLALVTSPFFFAYILH